MPQGKQVQVGGFNGPQQQKTAKTQDVIATIPLEVKKTINMLFGSNSVCWVVVGLLMVFADRPLETWVVASITVMVFWCVIALPFFGRFITRIDWGQKGN